MRHVVDAVTAVGLTCIQADENLQRVADPNAASFMNVYREPRQNSAASAT